MPIDPNDMATIAAFSDATARALAAQAADITALRNAVDNLAANLATHISNAPHAAPVDLAPLQGQIDALAQEQADFATVFMAMTDPAKKAKMLAEAVAP